jgi:hypothetical protein
MPCHAPAPDALTSTTVARYQARNPRTFISRVAPVAKPPWAVYADCVESHQGSVGRLLNVAKRHREAVRRYVTSSRSHAGTVNSLAPLTREHVSEPSVLSLLKELMVPHPLAALSQKLNVSGHHLRLAKKFFVFASGYVASPFARFADEARALGWPVQDLQTHQFPMLSMPLEWWLRVLAAMERWRARHPDGKAADLGAVGFGIVNPNRQERQE